MDQRIRSKRLILRKPRIEDAKDIFDRYTQDPEVSRFVSWQTHQKLADSEAYMEQAIAAWSNGPHRPYAIELQQEPGIIGMIAARFFQDFLVNLGFTLARKHWNHGYMTEAVAAIIQHCMSHSHIFRVEATCDIDNIGSARVMEKAGMQLEGIQRKAMILPAFGPIPRDMKMYAVIKETSQNFQDGKD